VGDVSVFGAGHLDVHDIQVVAKVASAGRFTHAVKDAAVVTSKMQFVATACKVWG